MPNGSFADFNKDTKNEGGCCGCFVCIGLITGIIIFCILCLKAIGWAWNL